MNILRIAFAVLAASTVSLCSQAPAVADKHAEVAGYASHYLESGAGPPVVLVHGLDVRMAVRHSRAVA